MKKPLLAAFFYILTFMKKWIKLCLVSILLAFTILYHQTLFYFLVKNGLSSWAFAYLAPYLTTTVLIILTTLSLKKTFRFNLIIMILSIGILGGIAFASNPIYEFDLADNREAISIHKTSLSKKLGNEKSAVVFGTFSCPHCRALAAKLNILASRNPEARVSYLLYTKDKEKVDIFQKETKSDLLNYIQIKNKDLFLEMTEGSFPTIFYYDGQDFKYKWKNDDLGMTALDFLENLN